VSAAPLLATVQQLAATVDEQLADQDPKAVLYLSTASGIVRDEVRQYLSKKVNDVVRLRPINGHSAYLPELPITEFTKLEVLRGGAWSDVDPTHYDLDEELGRIECLGYHLWPATGRALRATYSHGYEAAEIPDSIVGAVLGLAARQWEIPIGVDNERVGQRSIKYLMLDSGFLPLEQLALDNAKIGRA
jgi:hypothetical protein